MPASASDAEWFSSTNTSTLVGTGADLGAARTVFVGVRRVGTADVRVVGVRVAVAAARLGRAVGTGVGLALGCEVACKEDAAPGSAALGEEPWLPQPAMLTPTSKGTTRMLRRIALSS